MSPKAIPHGPPQAGLFVGVRDDFLLMELETTFLGCTESRL